MSVFIYHSAELLNCVSVSTSFAIADHAQTKYVSLSVLTSLHIEHCDCPYSDCKKRNEKDIRCPPIPRQYTVNLKSNMIEWTRFLDPSKTSMNNVSFTDELPTAAKAFFLEDTHFTHQNNGKTYEIHCVTPFRNIGEWPLKWGGNTVAVDMTTIELSAEGVLLMLCLFAVLNILHLSESKFTLIVYQFYILDWLHAGTD